MLRDACIMADFDCAYVGKFVVGKDGEPVAFHHTDTLYLVHPYTQEMRERAASMRGREGFSYGKAVCVLPSAHFYARHALNDDLEEIDESDLETERDTED